MAVALSGRAARGNPVGIRFGKIFQLGSPYINLQVAAFYNEKKEPGAADWTIRPQIQFLFPK